MFDHPTTADVIPAIQWVQSHYTLHDCLKHCASYCQYGAAFRCTEEVTLHCTTAAVSLMTQLNCQQSLCETEAMIPLAVTLIAEIMPAGI